MTKISSERNYTPSKLIEETLQNYMEAFKMDRKLEKKAKNEKSETLQKELKTLQKFYKKIKKFAK